MKRPEEERQQFKIGEDVRVDLMGTIKAVEVDYLGQLRYVIENSDPKKGYIRAYVAQSMISRLPEPNDFGIPDPVETEASNG